MRRPGFLRQDLGLGPRQEVARSTGTAEVRPTRWPRGRVAPGPGRRERWRAWESTAPRGPDPRLRPPFSARVLPTAGLPAGFVRAREHPCGRSGRPPLSAPAGRPVGCRTVRRRRRPRPVPGGGQGWAPREAAHVPPLRVPLPASPGLGFSICQRFPLSVVTRTGDARGGGDARVQELIAHAGFGVTGGRGQWEHSACGSRSPAPLPAQHSDPGSGSLPGQRLGFSGWPGAPFLRFPHLSDSTPEGEVMRVHAEAAVTAVKCRSCMFTTASPAAWGPRPLGGDSR